MIKKKKSYYIPPASANVYWISKSYATLLPFFFSKALKKTVSKLFFPYCFGKVWAKRRKELLNILNRC